MAELFGFEIKRKADAPLSFAPKQTDDGAAIVAEGGAYGTYIDLDGSIRTEAELVNKYREMSMHPEVDQAIDDIVNEVVIQEAEQEVVELILDDVELSDRIKKLFIQEFKEILNLLEFNHLAYEVFRRWYVDGRLYYHVITDENNPKAGIIELRYIDPRKLRKIREVRRRKNVNNVPIVQDGREYYIYNDRGFAKTSGNVTLPTNSIGGIRIAKDSIIHCTSGLTSINGDLVQSYLHKAIKPLNQLRSMEDSLVIYRISRAPERRIFYIDVGNLPKMKAEQYLRDQMTKFTTEIGFKGFQNPDEVGAAAVDYLRVAGHLVFGYFWARMAQVALREIAAGNTDPFYKAKLQTARFYFARLFPETASLMRTARTGVKVLMDTDEALA